MNVLVFSATRGIEKSFPAKKGTTVEFADPGEFTKKIKSVPAGSIVYLDASSFEGPSLSRALAAALKRGGIAAGVMDPKGTLSDVAQLFHSGAADYIGKDMLKAGVSAARFDAAASFAGAAGGCAEAQPGPSVPFSGSDWKGVVSGREYMFCFLFVELDRVGSLKAAQFGGQGANPAELFLQFIESQLKGSGGKMWMWSDFGGVILFPFDGKRCPVIEPLFRLVLNRTLFSAEESLATTALSFRAAVHIGSTRFRDRGETGKIVSDSVNFIFHLGQKRAQPGCAYVTREVIDLFPDALGAFFDSDGSYESRELFVMKRPCRQG